jgi:hypothetical protein
MTAEASEPEVTIEIEASPRKRKVRDKRDWTGFDSLHLHLKPELHCQLNSKAALGKLAQSDVMAAALEQYLKVQPSHEEELQRLLKLRLPHPLYSSVSTQIVSNRSSWIETVQAALAKATQEPAPLPRSVPVVPRPSPKARAVGFLDLPVTDQTEDSGIREAVQS